MSGRGKGSGGRVRVAPGEGRGRGGRGRGEGKGRGRGRGRGRGTAAVDEITQKKEEVERKKSTDAQDEASLDEQPAQKILGLGGFKSRLSILEADVQTPVKVASEEVLTSSQKTLAAELAGDSDDDDANLLLDDMDDLELKSPTASAAKPRNRSSSAASQLFANKAEVEMEARWAAEAAEVSARVQKEKEANRQAQAKAGEFAAADLDEKIAAQERAWEEAEEARKEAEEAARLAEEAGSEEEGVAGPGDVDDDDDDDGVTITVGSRVEIIIHEGVEQGTVVAANAANKSCDVRLSRQPEDDDDDDDDGGDGRDGDDGVVVSDIPMDRVSLVSSQLPAAVPTSSTSFEPGEQVVVLGPGGQQLVGVVFELHVRVSGTTVDVTNEETGALITEVPLHMVSKPGDLPPPPQEAQEQTARTVAAFRRHSSGGAQPSPPTSQPQQPSPSSSFLNQGASLLQGRFQDSRRASTGTAAAPLSALSAVPPSLRALPASKPRAEGQGRELLVRATFTEDKLGLVVANHDLFQSSSQVKGAKERGEGWGVEIKGITPGGAAMVLGLQVGDVICRIGKHVLDLAREDHEVVKKHFTAAGKPVTVVVARWVLNGSSPTVGGGGGRGGGGKEVSAPLPHVFTKFSPGVTAFDLVVHGRGDVTVGGGEGGEEVLGFVLKLAPFLHAGARNQDPSCLVVSQVSPLQEGEEGDGGLCTGHAIVGVNGMYWSSANKSDEKGSPQHCEVPSEGAFKALCARAGRPLVLHVACTAASAALAKKNAGKVKKKDGNGNGSGNGSSNGSSKGQQKHHKTNGLGGVGRGLDSIGERRDEEELDGFGSETPERQRLVLQSSGKGGLTGVATLGGVLVTCSLSAPKLGLELATRKHSAKRGQGEQGEEGKGEESGEGKGVETAAGVVVAAVGLHSEARLLGVRVGDRVCKVNKNNIAVNLPHKNVAALIRLSGRPLTLVLERGGLGSLPSEGRHEDEEQDEEGEEEGSDNDEGSGVVGRRVGGKSASNVPGAFNKFVLETYASTGLDCVSASGGRLLVAAMAKGSPCECAGVERHDEVVAINGVPWSNDAVHTHSQGLGDLLGSGPGGSDNGEGFARSASSDLSQGGGGNRRGSTMGGQQQQPRRGSVVAMRRSSSTGGGSSLLSAAPSLLPKGKKKDPAEVFKEVLASAARPLVISLRRGSSEGPFVPLAAAVAPRKRFSLLSR